jgi:ParB family chromosome partitioning protein
MTASKTKGDSSKPETKSPAATTNSADKPAPARRSRFQAALTNASLAHSEATRDLPNTELTTVRELYVDQIDPNPHQPRKEFDPVKLRLLADAIDEHGLIQPIEVRIRADGRYELVVGERRLRAHKLLQKRYIRAMVVNITDEESSARSLIENIQRADLSDYEVYVSIKKHKADFPDSTYTYQALGLPKTEYHRIQSFDELPANVHELLTIRPSLLSGLAAEAAKQYFKKGIEDGRLEQKAVDKALKTIIQNAIDAEVPKITNLAQQLESMLEPGGTATQAKQLMAGEIAVASIQTKGKYFQVRLAKEALSAEKVQRLEEFIVGLYKE